MIKFYKLKECESTNDEAWKLFAQNVEAPLIVLAERQTKGRGRMGRSWQDVIDSKNIFCTLLIKDKFPLNLNPETMKWVALIAGVAAIEALNSMAPKHHVRLKWPNDLYFEDQKIGGILCESKIYGNNIQAIIIGMGINIDQAPMIASQKTATLSDALDPKTRMNDIDIMKIETYLTEWYKQIMFWLRGFNSALDSESKRQRAQFISLWEKYAKLSEYKQLKSSNNEVFIIQSLKDDGSLMCTDLTGKTMHLTQAID